MLRLESAGDLQKAGLVARLYSLQDVSLARFSATRSAPYVAESMPSLGLSTTTEASGSINEASHALEVQVKFEVSAVNAGSPASEPLVIVGGVVALDYAKAGKEAPGNVDAAMIDLFARINGVYMAWPYIREAVSSAFLRLGYPKLTLEPLIINPRPPEPAAAKK